MKTQNTNKKESEIKNVLWTIVMGIAFSAYLILASNI